MKNADVDRIDSGMMPNHQLVFSDSSGPDRAKVCGRPSKSGFINEADFYQCMFAKD
jgi:hypothetical protein